MVPLIKLPLEKDARLKLKSLAILSVMIYLQQRTVYQSSYKLVFYLPLLEIEPLICDGIFWLNGIIDYRREMTKRAS
jgi:hypothetical protein